MFKALLNLQSEEVCRGRGNHDLQKAHLYIAQYK